MSITSDIYKGIFDTIDGSSLGLNIAWPNVEFNEVPPYIAIHPLPAITIPVDIKNGDMHIGTIQVSVTYPAGNGIITATEKAGEVITLFPRNLIITEGTTQIKINRSGWQSPHIQEADEVMIPVSIPYTVHT